MQADMLTRRWTQLVRDELRTNPRRRARIVRMAGYATFVAVLLLVYRVPFAAYGAYVTLMACQKDMAASLKTSVGALVSALLAISLSLLLYMLDADEPGLRLPAMAVTMFAAMYLSRHPRLGPLAFLGGFLLVVTQTIIDQAPDTETLTHLLLWLLLIVLVPCLIVPLGEALLGDTPASLFEDGIRQRLQRAAAQFAGHDTLPPCPPLRELAGYASHGGASASAALATVEKLERISAGLPASATPAAWRLILADRCGQLSEVLLHGAPAPRIELSQEPLLQHAPASHRAIALAACQVMATAGDIDAEPASDTPPLTPGADAQRHRDGLRFAFKATLAAMACYILYSAADWSGIRTCIITCFFVALGSVGETVHKLTLRLAGALLGGLAAALTIVYAFPAIDTIGGFVLLFFGVSLLSAWIASSGAWIGYAGLQLAFAFYLGVLQDAGPTDDLTVLRDRLAGIVLGNIAMSWVFLTLWPVSSWDIARRLLAQAQASLVQLLRRNRRPHAPAVLALAQTMEDAERLLGLHGFDIGHRSETSAYIGHARALADVSAATYTLLDLPFAPTPGGASEADRLAGLESTGETAHDTPPMPIEQAAALIRLDRAITALQRQQEDLDAH